MPDRNWSPERVRTNFHIDVFSGICAGAYGAVVVAFLPVVVRRMGGSSLDVALVVAAPFVGHLLSPLFSQLFAQRRAVPVVAATATLSRIVFLGGVLVATTPLALSLFNLVSWIIAISNIATYTMLMQGIYPDRERGQAMGKVRVGASVAGIASASLAGLLIDQVPATAVFAAAALIGIPGGLLFGKIRYDGPTGPIVRRPARTIARGVWSDTRFRVLLLSFTVFGFGNLMNAAIYPLLLVDQFNAPNGFVGLLAALQSGAMVVAYLLWGRFIDRGSSLRLTVVNTALVLLVPIGYLLAPSVWALIPVAIIAGVATAGGDITFFTNIVQLAPRGRLMEYAAAQSLMLGVRGSIAPFVASALVGIIGARGVMVGAVVIMVVGLAIMARAVAAATAERLAGPAYT